MACPAKLEMIALPPASSTTAPEPATLSRALIHREGVLRGVVTADRVRRALQSALGGRMA